MFTRIQVAATVEKEKHKLREEVAEMDSLTIFGLFAVTAMLVSYSLEKRSLWFVLAFAGSCLLGSEYGSFRVHGPSGW